MRVGSTMGVGSRIDRFFLVLLLVVSARSPIAKAAEKENQPATAFHTSDRCLACHNGLTTPAGKDVSIGFDWRASIMANSSRDPYWQASVRRETLDHPESKAKIEDSCAGCHMPMARYESKLKGKLGEVFAHLPFDSDPKQNASAEDGVSCSVCHQISKDKLGTEASFNGGFVVAAPLAKDNHPEYGPFIIEAGQAHIMQTSTGGFRPTEAAHMQESALCATCHTLYTRSLSADGRENGKFPEQVPFLEWQHSDYSKNNSSCQSCHMPKIEGEAPIAAVLGELRQNVRQHTFVGANFFMLQLLNGHRDELSVTALPTELSAEADRTKNFLQSQAARVTMTNVEFDAGTLKIDVLVRNLSGHKLPTAYPSRRAWLHVLVRDGEGNVAFESGALNPDGSIRGNHNDADPASFEPHYREITREDQVEIYEPILKDESNHVTTGLAAATGYLKDNRLLPAGFQKETATPDIAVVGDAASDPNFTDAGDLIRYSLALQGKHGPFHVQAELWYQPIGYRWAHNLAKYGAAETGRFVSYYDAAPASTATVLAHAEAER